jgi:pyrroloquinoline quinone (PQQ) biosynthesis protein C
MSKLQKIIEAWRPSLEQMLTSPAFAKIRSGELSAAEYSAILRQVYHQVREHPQAMGVFTSRLRGDRGRAMVKTILKHAVSETGHDELAIADLRALGVDVADIRSERPLPATTAILGFMHYQLDHANPIGFLGYIFHLEFTPTAVGPDLMRSLAAAGIPEEAQTFIRDHAEIDVAHNKLMERYVEDLVQTEEDLEAVCWVARATARLYSQMFDDAIGTVQGTNREVASMLATRT